MILIKATTFNKYLQLFGRFQFSQIQNSLRLPSFNHFNLHNGIYQYLESQNIHTPTYIQYALLSSLNKQQNYNKIHHITSPTGSGKTLSYMIPVVNHLKQEEIQGGARLTQSMRPRAIILNTNKELVLQVRNVGKGLSHTCKIKCEGINIGRSIIEQRKIINDGVDILVTTYKRLTSMMDRKEVFLSNLDWIVIDQVDTFFQIGKLQIMLQKLRQVYSPTDVAKSKYSRLLLAGTTNSKQLNQYLRQFFDKQHIQIFDKKAHVNLQNIKHEFTQCFTYDKHQLLKSLLFRQKKTKTLIFCNTVKSLHELQYYFQTNGIKMITLHSQLSKDDRLKNYQAFRDSQQLIMLSTDLGARGLHFPNLDRVINYDFPLSTTDYLQRAGRTGRAGQKGLVITIYQKKDLPIIQQLKGASFNQPIQIKNSAYGFKNREQTKHESKYKKSSKVTGSKTQQKKQVQEEMEEQNNL